jgi:DNA-binding NarL/FixJ family response regulator
VKVVVLAGSIPDLPPRLRRTLPHLAKGLSRKEIAARLKLTHSTEKSYVEHLRSVLQTSSRSEVILYSLLAWATEAQPDRGSAFSGLPAP